MENIPSALEKLGLDSKETSIYISLLSLGPSPIRKIAEHAGINRGTTHDTLRELRERGLVSYYHKEKRQHFVAEEPAALANLLRRKQAEVEEAQTTLKELLPKLQSFASGKGNRPTVKYYEKYSGIRSILEDALDSVEKLPKKEYAAYSSSSIRP